MKKSLKMAKIHGLAYIVIGLFVSILSLKLNYEKLIFFFYVGLIFVLVGAIKLAIGLGKSRSEKKERIHHKVHAGLYCRECGNALRLSDKFCTKCGAKV